MIYSNYQTYLKHREKYPAALRTALDSLKDLDLAEMVSGEYIIQTEDIYGQLTLAQSREMVATSPERHEVFIDIHYLAEGKEKIGFASLCKENPVKEDKLQENDVLLFESVKNEQFLYMEPGNFAIFFPWDIHRPWCAVDKPAAIAKVVLKVKYSLL